VTILFVCAPPAGEACTCPTSRPSHVHLLQPTSQCSFAVSFIVSLSSYPTTFIQLLCVFGLFKIRRDPSWKPAFRCPLPVLAIFILGSLFLLIAPLIPPHTKSGTLPYWLSPVVALSIVALGVPYYLIRFVALPWLFGCRLEASKTDLSDGSAVTRYKWVKNG